MGENEAWGSWGQEIHILHVNIYDFVLFLFVIIELFPNSVFQLYCPKYYYKQNQWNTLPVTMITEILIDYYDGCRGISGKYLCLAILTNYEECHFSRSTNYRHTNATTDIPFV